MTALDAGTLWPAIVLLLSAVIAWLLAAGARRAARGFLRLAAALQAGLAIFACVAGMVSMVLAPLTCALASVLLGFAVQASFRRPSGAVFATLALVVCCMAGLGAAFSGEALPAIVPQIAAIVAMLVVSRRGLRRLSAPSIQLAAGALALLAAAASLSGHDTNALQALLLFSAAGLLGITLAVARISDTFVKKRSPARRGPIVGGFG